jgi:hypothetical protein
MNNPFRKPSLFESYAEAQRQMRYWRDEELRLRKEVADMLAPYNGKEERSSHNLDGLIIKVERKHTYTIDKDADFSDLSPAEQECFSWSPRLLLKAYKSLTDRSAIDSMLTVKEAPPTITILEK